VSDPGSDSSADARANIRDTIKWLVAGFAAVVAAVVGTAPLTNLGGLPPWRLAVALASGGAGLACLFFAIRVTLKILVTPVFFLRDIVRDAELATLINDNHDDMLPPGITTVEQFVNDRTQVSEDLLKLLENPPGATEPKPVKDAWDAAVKLNKESMIAASAVANRVLGIGHFERLRRAFEASLTPLFALAAAGVLLLVLFAWAVTPGKQSADPGNTMTVKPLPA
jgi:hypothetical protein